ncbi:MAG: YggT family protein [SAR86 cluster bacterium]|uniref:YggT family protein n=1 Tax=SAR86 cluster bacterium TaxID=2030880 RepID=A0A2A4MQR7_9GAMM|nr:MAG: YggT family protein [SAR86 cluster bacterium]
MDVMTNSTAMIVSYIGFFYVTALLLRFLLQIAKADFYNPVSQSIVKITNPPVLIFRRLIPGYKGIDFSTLILAIILEGIGLCALVSIYGGDIPPISMIVTWSVVGIVLFIINIYFFAIIGSIVMSWVMMLSGNNNPHPMLQLIWQLTEPVMAPLRKVLPNMGGMDFSPMVIIFGSYIIVDILEQTFSISPAVKAVLFGVS